ncbi:MAG: YkgJ family cysteine cluster protein, partial [Halobaculum sp.]
METNCEGCAGCCLDWRPLGGAPDHERRGRYRALDDTYNLVPLTSDDVRTFLDAGQTDALAPRLFTVHDDADGDGG